MYNKNMYIGEKTLYTNVKFILYKVLKYTKKTYISIRWTLRTQM